MHGHRSQLHGTAIHESISRHVVAKNVHNIANPVVEAHVVFKWMSKLISFRRTKRNLLTDDKSVALRRLFLYRKDTSATAVNDCKENKIMTSRRGSMSYNNGFSVFLCGALVRHEKKLQWRSRVCGVTLYLAD